MRWYHYLIMLLVMYFFCGCNTKYVPIETVRYDSLMVSKLMKDSIFVRDSVYVKEKGDTIFKYKDKYVYLMRESRDTMYVDRERQIPVPVERNLTKWEKVKDELGGWAMLVVVIIMTMKLRKWIARRYKRQ